MNSRFDRSLTDAALFPRVERRCVGQRIADLLRDAIMSEALRPQAKLPSQREMAEHLGVGVPTLREAIGVLVAEGLLVCRQGLGTFVTTATTTFHRGGDAVGVPR